MKYTESLKKTCKSIKKQPSRFLSSILCDLALVFLYLGIFYYAFVQLLPHLEVMVGAMTEGLSGEMNPAFYSHYHAALGIITFLVLALFVVFVLIKGSNYNLFVLDKKEYWKYMLKFAGVNVIWGILLFLLLSLYLNFVFSTVMALNPLISLKAAGLLFYIACAVVVYFASLSYVLIDGKSWFKNTFVIGIKKADILLWNFLVVFVIVYLLKFLVMKSPLWGAVLGMFVLLPLIGVNRLFVKGIVGKNNVKVKKDKKK
ncbi:MAG: hypothetical protein U9R34_05375 [Nanoarchaeota archaeon]|nr:hypothetical protein [Nanoarchaeota archaeon]